MQEKILNAILDNQESIQGLGVKFEALTTTVADIGIKVDDQSEKMTRFEDMQNNTYNKIDGFLTVINRHEAEISALRAKYERLENRLEKLELRNT